MNFGKNLKVHLLKSAFLVLRHSDAFTDIYAAFIRLSKRQLKRQRNCENISREKLSSDLRGPKKAGPKKHSLLFPRTYIYLCYIANVGPMMTILVRNSKS